MTTATLNGHRTTHASVDMPAWGAWWADVKLDDEVVLSGAVELVLADLTLRGTVVSGGPAQGRSVYRVAAGAAAWRKPLPAKSYVNDAGVKRSTVLLDAASSIGETLDASTIPAGVLGPAFVREAGSAARLLELLASQAWYVGEDGKTRLGRRAATVLTSDATRGERDDARGTLSLAAESIASILPGVVVDGREAVDVRHEVTPEGMRSMLWFAGLSPTSRLRSALGRVLDELLPYLRFLGTWEYRVVTQDDERLNLQPVRVSTGMPDLRRVMVRPGVAGCRADVALGSRVLVSFVDASPVRPVVVGFEDAEGEGFVPNRLDLVGEDDAAVTVPGAVGRVVRYGDTVVFPVGSGATPTEMPVVILTPQTLSRVRA